MTSKTVDKALSILDVFTVDSPTWGLRELARHLDMNHTIVHRILSTFEEKGYLYCHPETKKYQLGIKFIELNHVVEEHLNLFDLIQPIMKNIALDAGESVVLTILDDEEGVFVKIVESDQKVRFAESVGKRNRLFIGASHKIILAYLPRHIQIKIIDQGIQDGDRHIDSKERLLERLESIRGKGWCYTEGETFEDVAAYSVPLFDNRQMILGSLSIAGPRYRFSQEKSEQILPMLKENIEKLNSILSKVYFPSRRNFSTTKFM
ncbi:IclR family transcriptional regulator [Planococcus sp. N028]|uniref:IclR family transcriptional regulator n=1 Tax=Planococcus shixiaomingii TaxID=3058393 RepID=A0ABT8N190_9BACL|nr:IclR family transcriptional regulator [Planococcus sp. N028]MDN7241656.1 IclR family transcriptional regulator [Planococcus sp. N028]